MADEQSIRIALTVAGAFLFRWVIEQVRNYFRARKGRTRQANRQQ